MHWNMWSTRNVPPCIWCIENWACLYSVRLNSTQCLKQWNVSDEMQLFESSKEALTLTSADNLQWPPPALTSLIDHNTVLLFSHFTVLWFHCFLFYSFSVYWFYWLSFSPTQTTTDQHYWNLRLTIISHYYWPLPLTSHICHNQHWSLPTTTTTIALYWLSPWTTIDHSQ